MFSYFGSYDEDGNNNESRSWGTLSFFILDPSDSIHDIEDHLCLDISYSNKSTTDPPDDCITLRGGDTTPKQARNTFSGLFSFLSFWKDSERSQLDQKQQAEILASTNVTAVSAPNSELLPPDIITQSAERAQLIGGTLTPATLDLTATYINNWYTNQGYVINSVIGATLVPNKNDKEGRVELKVREAKLSTSKNKSVVIRFVEKCNNEPKEGEEVLSIPIQSKSNADNEVDSLDEKRQYQKYRITSGRSKPLKVAKMVGIAPGSHFRIIPQRWTRIIAFPGGLFGDGSSSRRKSAIFSTVHAVRPIPHEDGTISVEIVATENKPFVSLEYGVTKSLYSDQWEAEFDLKHANAFGGGEVVSLTARKARGNSCIKDDRLGLRSVSDGPTSWKMSITDDFTGDSGYDLELFRDHVGTIRDKNDDDASLAERTGSTMRIRLPNINMLVPRTISTNFERIVDQSNASAVPTQSASLSVDMGPINVLRSRLSALMTIGAQRTCGQGNISADSDQSSSTKPYFRGAVTSQKIFPLFHLPFTPRNKSKMSVDLAMRHVVSVSTKYLPRHEALIHGLSSRIRGYVYNQPQTSNNRPWTSLLQINTAGKIRPPAAICNSICGNIELRLPFEPFSDGIVNNNVKSFSSLFKGTLIAFGDWAFSQAHFDCTKNQEIREEFVRYSSFGVGYRKITHGIPLKIDAAITEHGTGGIFFGIGRDFGA